MHPKGLGKCLVGTNKMVLCVQTESKNHVVKGQRMALGACADALHIHKIMYVRRVCAMCMCHVYVPTSMCTLLIANAINSERN